LPGVKNVSSLKQFVTSAAAGDNMTSYPLDSIKNILLKPRSIATIVIQLNPKAGREKLN